MQNIQNINLNSFSWLSIRDLEIARKEAGDDATFKETIEEFGELLPSSRKVAA